jgi:hypothetical protein
MFRNLFACLPKAAAINIRAPASTSGGESLRPHPSTAIKWKRESAAEWLKPDFIAQDASRIARHPQYYDWCRELVTHLFRHTPQIIVQPVSPVRSVDDQWTSYFRSAVVRWILLVPRGDPDRRHYCNCLAVCLNLSGYDTDEEIEDFVAHAEAVTASTKDDRDASLIALSDFGAVHRKYAHRASQLWIRAVPVLRATQDRTFPRGSPLESRHVGEEQCFIHRLRALNPLSLPPIHAGAWNDGHIAWLDKSSFLAFLNQWATGTPLAATDVPYGEEITASTKDSRLASGFAEICKACGDTYFDVGGARCERCGCHPADRHSLTNYVTNREHIEWVRGNLKTAVDAALKEIEESRRRDRDEQRRAEELRLEQKRAEEAAAKRQQEQQEILSQVRHYAAEMERANETIVALRHKLELIELKYVRSDGRARETCLRELQAAIAQYDTAYVNYAQWQSRRGGELE